MIKCPKDRSEFEIIFQRVGRYHRYIFVSPDGEFLAEGANPLEAARAVAPILQELRNKGNWCRISAYKSLGEPAIRTLRDAGADCRFRLLDWPPSLPPGVLPPAPPPIFSSWDDYLARTSQPERMARCREAAKRANRKRLFSVVPEMRLTGQHIWGILGAALGRCAHCGSLAVERRPVGPHYRCAVAMGASWASCREPGACQTAV